MINASMRFPVAFVLFLTAFASVSIAVEKVKPIPVRVFILHSYEKGHACGQPQDDGVVAVLHEAGYVEKTLFVQEFYMDTKRKNNTPELIAIQAEQARKEIEAFAPDVLVTLDDNAFRTVALPLAGTKLPIVFCGLNGQPEAFHKIKPFLTSRSAPGSNITGVYEKLHFIDAVRVHKKIFPALKRVRAFTDMSPTGRAISKQIQIELEQEPPPVRCDLIVVQSWEHYKTEILAAAADSEIGALYPAALLLKDAAGKTYTAPDIFAWTVQYSGKPEIALNYAFTRLGLFGGAAVDFYAMGRQAGEKVVRILKGQRAADISIDDAKRYALAFNLKRVRQLGVSIPQDILLAADEIVKETEK